MKQELRPAIEARITALASTGAVGSSGWADDVRKLIGPVGENRAVLEALVRRVLATEPAIAHLAWPDLVGAILDQSMTIQESADTALGGMPVKRYLDDIGDEAGILAQYDDLRLYTFDLVAELLAVEATARRVDWAELVISTCEKKKACVFDLEEFSDPFEDLLLLPHTRAHAAFDEAARAIRDACPELVSIQPEDRCVLEIGASPDRSFAAVATLIKRTGVSAARARELAIQGGREVLTGSRAVLHPIARQLSAAGLIAWLARTPDRPPPK